MRNLSDFEKTIVTNIARSTVENRTCVIHSISMYNLIIDVKSNSSTEVKIVNPEDNTDTSDLFEQFIAGDGSFNKAYNELYYTVNLIEYLKREGYLMVSEDIILASIFDGTEPSHTIIDNKLCNELGKISDVRFIATQPLIQYYLNDFKTDHEVKEEKKDKENRENHSDLVKINNRLLKITIAGIIITAIGTGFSIYYQYSDKNETKIIDMVNVKFEQPPIEGTVKIIDTVKVKIEQPTVKNKAKKGTQRK